MRRLYCNACQSNAVILEPLRAVRDMPTGLRNSVVTGLAWWILNCNVRLAIACDALHLVLLDLVKDFGWKVPFAGSLTEPRTLVDGGMALRLEILLLVVWLR